MDAPIQLTDPALQARLARAIDPDGKVAEAVIEIAPVAGRRVLLLGASPRGRLARTLRAAGGTVTTRRLLDGRVSGPGRRASGAGGQAFDLIVASYCGFDGAGPATAERLLAAAQAALRPGGRIVAVQAYGRDDVSRLLADPEREARQIAWNDRRGPLLASGWRVRTLHCWWAFGSLRAARGFLTTAFPATGPTIAAELHRPRLSFKVGIFHRTPESDGSSAAGTQPSASA